MQNTAPFLSVLLLSAAQFFSDKFNIEKSKYREYLKSFGAAIAVTYLLLSLLPEAYKNSGEILLLLPVIIGFSAIHLLEKSIYSKFLLGRYSLRKLKTYHDELHALIIFLYHFSIGAVLMEVLETDFSSGLLFLPPLIMFSTIGNWSLHHLYLKERHFLRLLLAFSTILGALSTKLLIHSSTMQSILLSFVAGFWLFAIVRESLPKAREGKPMYFVAGVLLYTLLTVIIKSGIS